MPPISEALSAEIVELLPRLRRFARALAGNISDADDLVQIAIERALARSDQLRRDAPLAGWMFGILRNAWLDEIRVRKRRHRVFAPAELGEQVADPRGGHAEVLTVQQAMQRLPEEQREVISLVLIEGLSYREAAQVIDVPIGTVTSRLARGREALQAMLGDSVEDR
jgi:RNA polymerase sigma-70 factor (ECF subfamily)